MFSLVLAVAAAGRQLLRQLQQGLGNLLRLRVALAATLERLGGIRTGKLGGILLHLSRGRGRHVTSTAATASDHLIASTAGAAATARNELIASTAGAAAASANGRSSSTEVSRGQGAHLFYTSLEKILRRAGETVGLRTSLWFHCELLC